MRFFLPVLLLTAVVPLVRAQVAAPSLGGCSLLPPDNVWHTRVDTLPVHPRSNAYVASLGASSPAHPDFGYDANNGIPYNLIHGNSTPAAKVNVLWPFTSDPGPYPIPPNALVQSPADPTADWDHHLSVLDTDNCLLYEAYHAIKNPDNSWNVYSISKFDLRSDALKPADWSSANAAGTAILPALVRYDEVAAGHIDHAISMTATGIGNQYVWPASRTASSLSGAQYPPMGTRFRLKASVDISSFSPNVRVVLEALKTYGAILTDNGASWFLTGVPDSRWNDGEMHALTQLHGSDFEAVDESSLMVSSSSGQARAGAIPTGWVNIVNKLSGQCLEVSQGLHSFYASSAGVGGLHQWTCNGSTAQKFQFVASGGSWAASNSQQWLSANGNGYIINSSNGLQVAIPNGTDELGAQMVSARFKDRANWIWKPVAAGGGYFYFQSLSNDLVLENMVQTGYANGSAVQQSSYIGGTNQLWKIVPAGQAGTSAAKSALETPAIHIPSKEIPFWAGAGSGEEQ